MNVGKILWSIWRNLVTFFNSFLIRKKIDIKNTENILRIFGDCLCLGTDHNSTMSFRGS
jgi:hypothetical protein